MAKLPVKPSFAAATERDLHIAIYSAMDWTQQEIGDVMGLSQQAIAQRVSIHREYIERTKALVRGMLTPYIQKLKDSWEIKQKNRDKGHKLVGKVLDQGLQETKSVVIDTPDGQIVVEVPVEPTAVQLKAADMAIARVEGQPLDRKAILELSMNDGDQRREVDGGKLDEILAEVQQLNQIRSQSLMISGVQEAELVNESDPNVY